MTISLILAFALGLAVGMLAYRFILDKKHTGEGELKNALSAKEAEASLLKELVSKKDIELDAKNNQITELSKLSAVATQQLQTIETLKKEFEQDRERIFKAISQEVLESKVKNFNEQAKTSLSPIEQDIKNFREKVEKLEEANKLGQQLLRQEIENIVKVSGTLQENTVNLTSAIKGDPGTKGVWGEITLFNILERAGLKSGVDFLAQKTEGKHRFDILLKLPQDKWIIIDSKTTFENYMNFVSEQDVSAKQNYLKAHVSDIKKTIDELSKKEYHADIKDAQGRVLRPDFTLMFVNPESALDAALKSDNTLLSYAWNRNIVLVSADTLINTVEIVRRIWNIERQQQEMEDVVNLIKKLNQKFTYFLAQFSAVELKAKDCLEAIGVARGHIDGDSGAILPVINEIQKTYRAPEIPKNNQLLVEKCGYDYSGKGACSVTLLETQGKAEQ